MIMQKTKNLKGGVYSNIYYMGYLVRCLD